jgi:hypothetical protein
MPSKLLKNIFCLLALLSVSMPVMSADELSTLFTTPQERQVINANRYKTDEGNQQEQVVAEETEQSPVQMLAQEEITASYRISGISLSTDGQHTVWIKSRAYQDGETLDDKSRIKVIAGKDVGVRITAPDGKHYYGTSGETLALTYLAAVKN